MLEKQDFAAIITDAAVSRCAVSGLGGIGKTQLAIAYSYSYQKDYDLILWIDAERSEYIVSAYKRFLKVPVSNETSLRTLIDLLEKRLFIKYVKRNKRWLIIYDNVEDSVQLEKLLPQVKGHVIVTSRFRDWSQTLELGMFQPEEAVDYLFRATGREKTADETAARLVAKRLGFLPLALAQAASYIRNNKNATFQEYLTALDREPDIQLGRKLPADAFYEKILLTTWNITIDKLASTCPLVTAIMNRCAYLDPDDVPLWFFLDLGSEREVKDAVKALSDYSMISFNENKQTVSIHRLVQDVTIIKAGASAKHHLMAAISLLAKKLSIDALSSNDLFYMSTDYFSKRTEEFLRLVTHIKKIVELSFKYEEVLPLKVCVYFGNCLTYFERLIHTDNEGYMRLPISLYSGAPAFGVDRESAAALNSNLAMAYAYRQQSNKLESKERKIMLEHLKFSLDTHIESLRVQGVLINRNITILTASPEDYSLVYKDNLKLFITKENLSELITHIRNVVVDYVRLSVAHGNVKSQHYTAEDGRSMREFCCRAIGLCSAIIELGSELGYPVEDFLSSVHAHACNNLGSSFLWGDSRVFDLNMGEAIKYLERAINIKISKQGYGCSQGWIMNLISAYSGFSSVYEHSDDTVIPIEAITDLAALSKIIKLLETHHEKAKAAWGENNPVVKKYKKYLELATKRKIEL